MIVWVASYPRAGNRLCRMTLRRSFGAQIGVGTKTAVRDSLRRMLDEIGVGPDEDPMPRLRELDQPVFLKTHNLPNRLYLGSAGERTAGRDDNPALYVVRDGRDCLVSLVHYLREYGDRAKYEGMSLEETVTELLERGGQWDWAGHVRAWRKRKAPTELIRFEEMVKDPVEVVGAATKAVGVDLPPARSELPTFDQLRDQARDPRIMRRGKPASWRSEFPPDLLDEFWRLHGEQMDALGYPRHAPSTDR